jgi:hypothetical protein
MPARRLAAALALCAILLGGCGNTLQDRPIPHNALESLLLAPYPVYWLGRSFQQLAITEAVHDPGGAFTVSYGDCVVAGQSACVQPVRVITSPDNSFLAGGNLTRRAGALRGVPVLIARAGRTIEIPTAGVVVGVYALNARLAAAAAQSLVAINQVGAPGDQLPARVGNTGFANSPLPSQLPSPARAAR